MTSNARYCIIPADALDDERIGDLHLRVLCDFGRAADRNGWLQCSQSSVAKRLGRSRETVNRIVRDLFEWGYLRKQQRFSGKDGRQLVNDYQVLMDRAERPLSGRLVAPETAPPCDPTITPPVTSGDHTPCDPQTSHLLRKDPFLSRPLSSEEDGAREPSEFDRFWTEYPNKVGKRDAERAFEKARKRASFADIVAGLQRYKAKADDRPWCNPSTFLNQDRWTDQPATAPPRAGKAGNGRAPKAAQLFDDYLARRAAELQAESGDGP